MTNFGGNMARNLSFKPWGVYLGTWTTGRRGCKMVSEHRTRDQAEDAAKKMEGAFVGLVNVTDIRKKYRRAKA